MIEYVDFNRFIDFLRVRVFDKEKRISFNVSVRSQPYDRGNLYLIKYYVERK